MDDDRGSKGEGQKQQIAPKVAALLMLLETFSVEQLRQVAVAARRAREMDCPDLVIRFKGGRPRWIRLDEWDEMVKP